MAQISRQKELVASWLLFSTLEWKAPVPHIKQHAQYLDYSKSWIWMLYRDEYDADMRIIKT
jgi:hypothetical protein